jgi:hypothetical protein
MVWNSPRLARATPPVVKEPRRLGIVRRDRAVRLLHRAHEYLLRGVARRVRSPADVLVPDEHVVAGVVGLAEIRAGLRHDAPVALRVALRVVVVYRDPRLHDVLRRLRPTVLSLEFALAQDRLAAKRGDPFLPALRLPLHG